MAAGAWEPKGPCSEPLGTGDVGLSRSRCLRQVHCLAHPLLSLDFSISISPGGLGPPVGPGGASEGEGPRGSLPCCRLVGLARILATALCISALLGLSFPPPPTDTPLLLLLFPLVLSSSDFIIHVLSVLQA